jgi:NADH:ubiquinone oxidoreductase subunit E
MKQQDEIVICLGSSCFARGNKQVVQLIKKFLDEHQLSHKVRFRGKHCFGNCENGPGMIINQERFEHVTSSSVVEILESKFL